MGNIITLTPALTITKEEMDTALQIVEDCITEVEKG
jgi:4-aminobutyrate aminotransferase-like enzyme